MASIKLTHDKVAIVDDEDFEALNKFKWHVTKSGYAGRSQYYKTGVRCRTTFMHRIVNNTPLGMETDHINRDRLDNRKENLRSVTLQENAQNKSLYTRNSSGRKGVTWYARYDKWVVRIREDNTMKHLGYFDDLEEAAATWQTAAKALGRAL